MLTDFDSQGVDIAMKFPNVIRLGVDLRTVSDLGVNQADVEEHIDPLKFNKKTKKVEENTHWVGLNTMLTRIDYTIKKREKEGKRIEKYLLFYHSFLRDNLTYLRSNRIELGATTAVVGPQRFWDWLRIKMLKEFPNRDYNRAITVPETIMPQDYLDFDEAFKNRIKSILKPSHDEWKDQLSNHEGLIDNTSDKREEIENDMRDNHLMMNDDIKQLMKDINKLRKKYNL